MMPKRLWRKAHFEGIERDCMVALNIWQRFICVASTYFYIYSNINTVIRKGVEGD